MTHILIEDLENLNDLLNAISAITQVFADPAAFEAETQTFSKEGSDYDEETEVPEQSAEDLPPPPAPYIPCPIRGTHHRLADCWLCWSDVHRGAAVETDVLRTAWNLALARLIESQSP